MSGVLVFLLIPVLLLGLQKSLASPEAFAQVKDCLHESLLCKFAVWCLVAGLVFHLFAGIRHLLMDIHIGESREAGRWSARAVIACSALAVVTAFWLWG
jgi:succinate dehydrogenase / fumarate reductase cytochrome b subunit